MIEPFKYNQRTRSGSEQWLFRFGNGYGASVTRGPFSYGGSEGLFELAVIQFEGNTDNFQLCYDTHITNDVEGHLTENGVQMLLEQIRDLRVMLNDMIIDVDAKVVTDSRLLPTPESKQ